MPSTRHMRSRERTRGRAGGGFWHDVDRGVPGGPDRATRRLDDRQQGARGRGLQRPEDRLLQHQRFHAPRLRLPQDQGSAGLVGRESRVVRGLRLRRGADQVHPGSRYGVQALLVPERDPEPLAAKQIRAGGVHVHGTPARLHLQRPLQLRAGRARQHDPRQRLQRRRIHHLRIQVGRRPHPPETPGGPRHVLHPGRRHHHHRRPEPPRPDHRHKNPQDHQTVAWHIRRRHKEGPGAGIPPRISE